MIKTLLLMTNIGFSAGIYLPMIRRVVRRKATRDYSKTAQGFIVATQVMGLMLAIAENAHYLVVWYILQTVLTVAMYGLICKYWNSIPPVLRAKENSDFSFHK